jgi:hypothetical protein
LFFLLVETNCVYSHHKAAHKQILFQIYRENYLTSKLSLFEKAGINLYQKLKETERKIYLKLGLIMSGIGLLNFPTMPVISPASFVNLQGLEPG